jgi:hypothetical protein
LAAVIGVPPWHKDLAPLNLGSSSFAMADHQAFKAALDFVARGRLCRRPFNRPTLEIEGSSDPSHKVIPGDHDRRAAANFVEHEGALAMLCWCRSAAKRQADCASPGTDVASIGGQACQPESRTGLPFKVAARPALSQPCLVVRQWIRSTQIQ